MPAGIDDSRVVVGLPSVSESRGDFRSSARRGWPPLSIYITAYPIDTRFPAWKTGGTVEQERGGK